MNKSTFTQLVADKEGLTIEFKEHISSGIAKEICAFANTVGGVILIGVADDGTLVGVNQGNRIVSQVEDFAHNCSPRVSIRVKIIRVNKKDFAVVEVPSGKDKPYSCSEGFYIRNGANSQKLKRDEIIDFLNKEGHVKFELLLDDRFHFQRDFDTVSYKNFLKLAELPQKINRNTLFQNLSLARLHGKRLGLTKAGVLFFASKPEAFVPHSEITCVLYKDKEKIHVLERKDFRLNLVENVNQAMTFLERHLENEYEIKSLHRKEQWEVPLLALREAVLNAVIHRDYTETGASILVEIFSDRVSISNPGGLPPGLSPETFGTLSIRRNPVIADMFHRIGEVEKIGSGIRRMKEFCQTNGNPEPKFSFKGHFFIAEILKRKLKKKTELHPTGQVPDKYRTSTGQVPDKQKLLRYCLTPRKMREMMKNVRLSHRETFMDNYLEPLLKDGLLAMTDPASPKSPKQKYIATKKGMNLLKKS